MNWLYPEGYDFTNPIVAMGNFDGTHIGHQFLLRQLKNRADACDGKAVCITYYDHPLQVLNPSSTLSLLTERDLKENLLHKMGCDEVLFLRFDKIMAQMSPYEFLKEVIVDLLHPREIICGYDTHFGKGRVGGYRFLCEHEKEFGYRTIHVPAVKQDEQIVSSSLIRNMIRAGSLFDASRYLGKYYSIHGYVIHGKGLGNGFGYPTINLAPLDPLKLIPATGIYLTRVEVEQELYFGITNVGVSPTVKTDNEIEIETFILDFSGDLYGQPLQVIFLERLRDEIKFNSKEELIDAIKKDEDYAKKRIPLYR